MIIVYYYWIGDWMTKKRFKEQNLENHLYRIYDTTKGSGIACLKTSCPSILDCKVYKTSTSGIWVKDESKPKIKNCEIYEYGIKGINVEGVAKPDIQQCKIS